MMPMRPFLSGVMTLRQCPITSDDCQEFCDFIGHCLKVMTPDKKGPLGIIFDMSQFKFSRKNLDIDRHRYDEKHL